MFIITTSYKANDKGEGRIIAKGHGKQRTVVIDHSLTSEAKHASAVGALLNVLCDDRQRAMLRHPSGGQRVRHQHKYVGRGQGLLKDVWTINV